MKSVSVSDARVHIGGASNEVLTFFHLAFINITLQAALHIEVKGVEVQ
jgi:hypothetical protein